VWHKAVTLGRQLDPANPMFQDGGAAPRAAVASAAAATPPRSPLHAAPAFNVGDISISPKPETPAKSPADILAGAEDAVARSSTTPVAVATAAQGTRSSAAEAAGAATAALAGTLAASKSGVSPAANDLSTRVDVPSGPPSFDLDFHLDDDERPAPLKAVPAPEPKAALTSSPPAFGAPTGALELDKLDLSFNPERPVFDDPTPSVLDGQWHDAATKLDLAKAYQEMGDTDGAREILQEVLHEGDEQQKSEAKGLLAKLAS
jgi:pilus assembly protein FimV